MESITVYVGFGANLGDPLATLHSVLRALKETEGVSFVESSPVYRTAPVGGPPDQPDYCNAVLRFVVTPEILPHDLLGILQVLENEHGRVRKEHWGPRTCDLDILFYGNRIVGDATLTIPHPRIIERAFVLVPLCDLDANLIHPVTGKPVFYYLQKLPVNTLIRW